MNRNKKESSPSFYRMVMTLVLPIALQNLINVAVQSADVIMLGRLPDSEVVLSAASLGGQVCFVMTLIFFGLSSGVSVLVAQYWGKQDKESISAIWGIAMRPAMAIGLLFTAATFFFTRPIMSMLTSEEAVIEAGTDYLKIVCISYIFISFSMIYLNMMRSMEQAALSAIVYGLSLIINIIANYILIFGKLGCPALGIRGAAIGTVIARISEFIMAVIYNRFLIHREQHGDKTALVPFLFSMFRARNPLLSKDFVHFSIPVVANELLWGLGMAVNVAIIGHLGSDMASANAVIQVARQLAQVLSMGIANAAAIVLGKTIGEGNIIQAKEYGRRFMRLGFYAGIFGALIILIARPILLAFMNLNSIAIGYLSFMLLMISWYVLIQAYDTVGIVGVLRSGGDTRFGLYVEMGGLWGVSILFSFLCAFVFRLNAHIVYVVMLMDEVVKLPFIAHRVHSLRWLKDVTRE